MTDDVLRKLVAGVEGGTSPSRPAGIEIRQDLEPAGGLPVQPPSYEGPLEIHKRYIDGAPREAIELDSVGSAANRNEEVLLDTYRSGDYPLPVSSTKVEPGEGEPIVITTLEAPHRIFDAWFRESDAPSGDGTFGASEHGRELSLAHLGALDPILETSAHDLLFGVWDSHQRGPHGQLKVARSLATTVIGLDPLPQARFAARRDPLNLGDASTLPKGEKRLSKEGLSSIPPQVRGIDYAEGGNGGVAITEARHLGFLSFASLRRLRFRDYENTDVRVLLAALALYALAQRAAAGWSLRSGCALVARGEPRYTLVDATGGREELALDPESARQLFERALAAVEINDRRVALKAGERLNGIVDRSVRAAVDA